MSAIRKKRISKKTKRAWRKTDINDVEDFLEEQRQEERIGTFAEKPDEELFIVDATLTKDKQSLLSEKQKRKLNAKTQKLRSHQPLENTSKVQDPIVKRNIVKQKKNGRNIEEEVRNPTRPRHFRANKDRDLYYQKLEARSVKPNGEINTCKDIWQEEDFQEQIPHLKDEKGWISRNLALHVVGNIGKKVVKLHDSLRHKTSKASKFELPHPGMSYNPSLEAHQDLINNVLNREEKIIKENKHLKRVTTDMFSKVTPEERDRRRLVEMTSDDKNEDDEDKDEDKNSTVSEDDTAYKSVNPPVENKKKSKQARRKELKQKELQKRQEAKKALKKQIADLNKIKSINAEVVTEEVQLNQLKKHRKKVSEQKKYEPKVLGRNKFVEPDVDVNMPEDICGNLRNVKVESNLITDRFKNLQKRNILPVTVAVTRKKAKVKRFLRNSHKEAGVSYQMLREKRNAAKTAV